MHSPLMKLPSPKLFTLLSWTGDVPIGSLIAVRTRTGNELEEILHYYSDRGGSETRATVSIYIQGELVETLTATLPTSGHRWKIGYVDFAATGIGTFHLEDVVETYYGRACPDC